MTDDQRPDEPAVPWWSPHPVAIMAALLAGAVCFGSQTLNVGSYEGAEYGMPMVYRWAPYAGGPEPPWFAPGALAVDLLLSAIVAFVCTASVQIFALLMFRRRRLTLRRMMVLVALVALALGLRPAVGPHAEIVLAPLLLAGSVLVFGAPFALALLGMLLALDAVLDRPSAPVEPPDGPAPAGREGFDKGRRPA